MMSLLDDHRVPLAVRADQLRRGDLIQRRHRWLVLHVLWPHQRKNYWGRDEGRPVVRVRAANYSRGTSPDQTIDYYPATIVKVSR